MVLQPLASFALRPRRGMTPLVLALVTTTIVGCGHRRSSLRPVFIAPSRVAAPAVVPSCPTTIEPAPLEAPAAGPAPTVVEPSTPPLDVPAPPAEAAPRRPSAVPGEPPLLSPPSETPRGTSLTPSRGATYRIPRASLNSDGRRAAPGRLRQALRERLRPFVNDPDDMFTPPKADRPWKYVVMHHSAHASGSYGEIDREHRKVLGYDGCGYHFVIGNGTGSPDGKIEVAQRWSNQKHGAHCRDGKTADVNEYGIGICLVGDLDHSPPTPRQIESARALIAYLGDRYAIPADHIGSHADLAASPTACPGKHFPAQAILAARDYAQR